MIVEGWLFTKSACASYKAELEIIYEVNLNCSSNSWSSLSVVGFVL